MPAAGSAYVWKRRFNSIASDFEGGNGTGFSGVCENGLLLLKIYVSNCHTCETYYRKEQKNIYLRDFIHKKSLFSINTAYFNIGG